MALVSKLLELSILQMFKQQKGLSAKDAANKWARAYADYAQMAQADGIPPLLTGAEAFMLENTLYAVLSSPKTATPATMAAAWAAGIVSFWNAPPVFFGPGTVVTASLAMPVILPLLTASFLNSRTTPEIAAASMASTLDAATRTVIVFMPVPLPHPTTLI
jgi:hypothetical protein